MKFGEETADIAGMIEVIAFIMMPTLVLSGFATFLSIRLYRKLKKQKHFGVY